MHVGGAVCHSQALGRNDNLAYHQQYLPLIACVLKYDVHCTWLQLKWLPHLLNRNKLYEYIAPEHHYRQNLAHLHPWTFKTKQCLLAHRPIVESPLPLWRSPFCQEIFEEAPEYAHSLLDASFNNLSPLAFDDSLPSKYAPRAIPGTWPLLLEPHPDPSLQPLAYLHLRSSETRRRFSEAFSFLSPPCLGAKIDEFPYSGLPFLFLLSSFLLKAKISFESRPLPPSLVTKKTQDLHPA
ncbi:hypothetical protein VNO77_27569 [Canavalia gladiata]|uniref:Uncharacterized protein n=1 Tax=Canavalia gladiata TaxID=3824 RepID=A0AAN9KY31_CANGL